MSSWRTLLLRIGDSCPEYGGTTDLAEHIETCYNTISRELEYSRDDILQFILQCAEQVPHKIPIYGTLVGLLNLETEDFAKTIVENTQTNLQDALDSGNGNRIRILMRFVTALMCSKVVQPGSVVELFETLLSSAATTVDEESGNPSWQPRADFYVTCILSCLPWCGLELNEQVPEEIERVLVGVEAYLSIRKHDNDGDSSIFEFVGENGGLPKKDHLEDLWHRIQDLSNNGWKVDSVPRPHLFFEAQLVSGKSHEFSSIACPDQPELSAVSSDISRSKQRHEAELKYPRRIYRLNIFPTSKFENMQPIDRFVVEEYLLDVLLFFNGCRKECAAYMVGLPVPFRYEYLMAETIFSQLLTLPQPPFRPIYYTLVIIDLCKALPGAFPAVVAGAVRALYKRIGDLDMECRSRLILWFSHHLANFQFIWPWNEWSYVLDLPKWAPQRVFVQEVLEREVRLSYWDKVKQSIENASALEELLPPKGGPSFKFGTEDAKEGIERTLSLELRNMVKEKKTAREIISWIEDSVVPLHGSKITLEIVVQTLLDIGSKSFTHLITVLERYGQVISKLCPEHDKQLMLMDEISSFWKNSTQMTAIAIDRMMGYRLISNLAIVSWVFSSSNSREFHTSDRPWEILKNAVNKTYNRICDLRKEISLLKESIKLAEASVTEAKSELDSAESKLEIVNGQPVPAETPGRLKRLKGYFDKRKEELVSIQENLEAKEVLLARASEENKNLFVSLYKSFWNILSDCLYQLSSDGRDFVSKPSFVDAMSVDNEEASEHELAEENGLPQNSQMNGENKGNDYNVGEQEQWCLTTLGYLKAFSTQYASEIWLYMEQLDAEIFTKKVHPLFRKAVYTGLRLHIDSELQ